MRSAAALDRLAAGVEPHATACLEFNDEAGLWAVAAFADEESRERWTNRLQAAFRLLADSGFGGERSLGWGHSAMPEFTDGVLPDLILPAREPAAPSAENPRRSRDGVVVAVAVQPGAGRFDRLEPRQLLARDPGRPGGEYRALGRPKKMAG
jgi:hypothetical protein